MNTGHIRAVDRTADAIAVSRSILYKIKKHCDLQLINALASETRSKTSVGLGVS